MHSHRWWAYTLVSDTVLDDDGNPRAAVFSGWTRGLPPVVHTTTLRELQDGPPALWWLPQDLAIGGALVESVLRTATNLRLLPILQNAAVAEAEDVELVCSKDVAVPVYSGGAQPPRAAVTEMRESLWRLVSSEQDERGVVRCAQLIETLGRDHPGVRCRQARLSLLRFPLLDGTRDHPALLLPEPPDAPK